MPSELAKQIKEIVMQNMPPEAKVTSVDIEGPEVAIYTQNPKIFFENDKLVARVAFELKKRVNIRTDKSLLKEQDIAEKKIREIVPAEADIKSIAFNPAFSEVVIESIKPGLVIGKGGLTSKQIILETGWVPNIIRAPTSPSEILKGIRHHLNKYSAERKKILQQTAEKIYWENPAPNRWIRVSALGSFREVGRSCIMVETQDTRVMLDCGINPAANNEDQYPYLDVLRYPVQEIDAIIISHAHVDHSGFLPYLFKLGYRGPVYCSVDFEERVIVKENGLIKTAKIGEIIDSIIEKSEEKQEENHNQFVAAKPKSKIEVPCFSRKDYKIRFKEVKEVIRHAVDDELFEITLKTGRSVKVTGSHSVFALKNGKILEKKVNELNEGDYLIVPQRIPTQETNSISIADKLKDREYHFENGWIKTKQSKGIPETLVVGKELARILGYFAAEGSFEKRGIRFSFGLKDEGLVKDLKKCAKEVFGLEAKEKIKNGNVISVQISSVIVKDLFKNYFFKEYKKATTKHVPEIIFNISSDLKMEFIDAYFKGDGTINLLNKTAHAVSTSKRLISDVAYLFTQLGINYTLFSKHIISSKTKNIAHRITINLSDFGGKKKLDKKSVEIIPLKESNFGDEWYYHRLKNRKSVTKERLKSLLNKGWVINTNYSTLQVQENLLKLAESDLGFLPIIKISKVPATNGFVYDFAVEEDQNFIGGNAPICLHNTQPTRDLMALLAFDLIDVAVKEGKEPPYSEQDVKEMVKYCIPREYREVTDIAPDMRLTFHNAAHILGSTSVHLHIGEGAHNLVYSADFKYGFTRLFNNIDINYPRLETLILESTYAGKGEMPERMQAEEMLINIIRETVNNGGNVLIPVFAVGRAQEIMLVIEEFYRRGALEARVYIDGMTKEASAIHTAYPEYLRKGIQRRILQNDSPFTSELFQIANHKNRQEILDQGGAVILASSGMLTGGASLDYFKKMASDPKNCIIFVGYQAEGSMGRKIQNGVSSIPTVENGKARALDIKMRVETVEGFSGHSFRNELLAYLRTLKPKPKRILVNHGDSTVEFAKFITNRFKINTTAPRNLDSVRIR
jgi:predicted metal-dependent RNase